MKKQTNKAKLLRIIRKTRLAMRENVKCVFGCDEYSGAYFVSAKKALTVLMFIFFSLHYSNAQTVKQSSPGIYEQVKTERTQTPAKDTGKKLKTEDGTLLIIYESAKGKYFVNVVSKKTGTPYRKYLTL